MRRTLLVTAVLLVSCLAFAAPPTTYTFVFDGFCDGMSLTLGNGAQMSNVAGPRIFVAGFHDFSGCGGGAFVNSGFKHGISKVIPPFATPVLDVVDPEAAYYLTVQYLVHATVAPCVWANYYSFDGVHNNNFLSGTCSSAASPRGTGSRRSSPRAVK